MKKPANVLIIAALQRVVNKYNFASDRHQYPAQNTQDNMLVIRQCHPQLELLVSLIREMSMTDDERAEVKCVLEYDTIIVNGEQLCDFVKRL